MNGRFPIAFPIALAAVVLLFAFTGCNRPSTSTTPTTAPATQPTVASLAPSATSQSSKASASPIILSALLITFDRTRGVGAKLPAVGDYDTVDWELLGKLRPNKIFVQFSPDRIPPGFRDRADALGISIVDVWPLDRLADVYARITDIGAALGNPAAADALDASIRTRMDVLARKSATRPSISVLLVASDTDIMVAGPGTFLDDLLKAAGGVNAAPPSKLLFFTLDPEALMDLKPDVILLLMPGASPAAVDVARSRFLRYTAMPAVVHNRVVAITDPDVLLPGPRVPDIAESFAAVLDAAAPTTTETHP